MIFPVVRTVVGKLLKVYSLLLAIPIVIALIYREAWQNTLSFLIVSVMVGILAVLLSRQKEMENLKITTQEGLLICGLAWLLFALFGSLPFVFSKQIPHFVDAFFESMSGFTTTGSSILSNVEGLSHSMLFWRSFTHLIGGMGVLVFALAIMDSQEQGLVHVMKAEVPGPQFGKLVSKIKHTARILYFIYLGMTGALIILLALGKMDLFEAMLHAFGAAGTGGFGIKNSSIGFYQDSYSEVVISVAMLLFGINFNLFYLMLLGHVKEAFKSEELRGYLVIIGLAVVLIFLNIMHQYSDLLVALKDTFFTVSSIVTTTGYSTVNYQTWPLFSQIILLLLMFVGGCAGSTAGGLKVSRVLILIKSAWYEITHARKPNLMISMHFEQKPIVKSLKSSITSYFALYMLIFFALLVLMSLNTNDFMTAFSSVNATFNNIGPGFNLVGPTANFGWLNDFSKIILSISMFMGRLEIIPVLILFSPKTYRKF